MESGFVVSFKNGGGLPKSHSVWANVPGWIGFCFNVATELQKEVTSGSITLFFSFGDKKDNVEMAWQNRPFAKMCSDRVDEKGTKFIKVLVFRSSNRYLAELILPFANENGIKKNLMSSLCSILRDARDGLQHSIEEIDSSLLAMQEGIYIINSQQTNPGGLNKGYRK